MFRHERAVDFITILEEVFPVKITFVHVEKKNLDSECETISFSWPIPEEQHEIHRKKLILSESAKTNNEVVP